jgi:hypothetical protein
MTSRDHAAAFRRSCLCLCLRPHHGGLLPALLGCLTRLGGVPSAAVLDNNTAMVAPRRGGVVRLVDEVAAVVRPPGPQGHRVRPRFPEGKGQGERTIGYLETSSSRCDTSPIWATCSSSTTAGPAPCPSNVGPVAWPARWLRPGGSSRAFSPPAGGAALDGVSPRGRRRGNPSPLTGCA